MADLSKITIPSGTTYDFKDSTARESLSSKQDKATSVATTLSASNWSNGAYDFTSTYPTSNYDVVIQPDGYTITSDQYTAWCKAQIVGNSNTNVIKALGTVPTVDIPVSLRIIPK